MSYFSPQASSTDGKSSDEGIRELALGRSKNFDAMHLHYRYLCQPPGVSWYSGLDKAIIPGVVVAPPWIDAGTIHT